MSETPEPTEQTAAEEAAATVHGRNRVGKRAAELNDTMRYTVWSVFQVTDALPNDDAVRSDLATEVEELFETLAKDDVVVRGVYDVAGFRADADFMLWLHAESSDALQDAYSRFRRTALGRRTKPVWSQMALHRPAEFNKSHIPAYVAGEEPRGYVAVYPFNRGYEWYLLPDAERRRLLAEHGMMSRDYPDVRANTVPAFALGDFEWLLAFEADDLDRIVDLMRHLRGSETRRHVREEIPFYTGKRRPVAEIVKALP
jgi:chlorite dismutase